MIEYDHAEAKSSRPSAVQHFDEYLDRLEKQLDVLGARLSTVTSRVDSDSVRESHPRPVPSSDLRGRLERLGELLDTLDRITREIDL